MISPAALSRLNPPTMPAVAPMAANARTTRHIGLAASVPTTNPAVTTNTTVTPKTIV
jgi:hypothetical protein